MINTSTILRIQKLLSLLDTYVSYLSTGQHWNDDNNAVFINGLLENLLIELLTLQGEIER